MVTARRVLVLIALLSLTSCSAQATAVPVLAVPRTATPSTPSTPSTQQAAVSGAPSAVSIPRVGVFSELIPTGYNPDGTAQVPPVEQPGQASWLEPGVTPGGVGPAVIYGHVSGRAPGGLSVPGVFARLTELVPGDEIVVDRYGAPSLRWRVDRVDRHPKDAFPTDAVYGDTTGPELRLVTCGGQFDPAVRSYRDNVVVYAVPA